MTIEDDIALLERVPTFAPLGLEALRILAIGAESRSIPQGATLFRAGEAADSAYVVESGSFRLLPGRERRPVEVAERGALLGELALLTATWRPATAIAQEPALVMRITRPLFLKMLDGYPRVAERLRQDLLARTERLADELGGLRNAFYVEPEPPASTPADADGTAVVEAAESKAAQSGTPNEAAAAPAAAVVKEEPSAKAEPAERA